MYHTKQLRRPLALFALSLLAHVPLVACGGGEEEELIQLSGQGDIAAVGDSLLGFHYPGDSIPEVAADALGLAVESSARGGETMLGGFENDIPNQYQSGDYQLLIASGGGNDIGMGCSCNADCDDIINDLINADGSSGAIVSLVERAVSDGLKVAWLGYMVPMPDAEEFSECGEELAVLRTRLTLLDERLDDMIFVDGANHGSGSESELYEEDGYHPSEEGSRVLGLAIAEAVAAEFGE